MSDLGQKTEPLIHSFNEFWILAMVAQRYRLRLKVGHPIEPQGIITLRPRYGMPMTIEPRALTAKLK